MRFSFLSGHEFTRAENARKKESGLQPLLNRQTQSCSDPRDFPQLPETAATILNFP
jgi:hypothetical protein